MRSALPYSLALTLCFAAPLAAQEPGTPDAGLSRAVVDAIIEFFNRPETIRLNGESRLPSGAEVVGDVAVLGGPFTLAGRISGRLVVINGDLRLESGAAVAGGITVVGGSISGLGGAAVAGPVVAHREALRYRRDEGRLSPAPASADAALSAGRQFGFGRTDLRLAVRGGYNRVEGLPIAAGARAALGASNPTHLEALTIYRTESGRRLRLAELGYLVRAEQFAGGRRALRLGVALRSEIEPIESSGLSDRENSLATFLLHRDHRDHYEREGWSTYLRLAPGGQPYDLLLEYRDETHRTVSAGGPWALVDNDRVWRPQPIVARGELRSAVARLRYDTRNDGIEPSAGWFFTAEVEKGLGGELSHAVTLDPETGVPHFHQRPMSAKFTAGLLDLRRYVRLGPDSRIAARMLAAGSVDGDALPPQRQHALGGAGSLPGHGLFRFDCGAREHALELGESRFTPPTRFYPYYGCDRIALAQLEYQSRLSFGHALDHRIGLDLNLVEPMSWVVFFNAGRAWIETDALDGRRAGQRGFATDAGLGLRLGRIGLYWAVPLSGGGGVNFSLRLGPRI